MPSAPLKPASVMRSQKIREKEDAIKRRLKSETMKSRSKAIGSLKKKKTGRAKYTSKYIRGSSEGFTKSDYGVGSGAAIPYQIGEQSKTYEKGKVAKPPVSPDWGRPVKKSPMSNKQNWDSVKGQAISRRLAKR